MTDIMASPSDTVERLREDLKAKDEEIDSLNREVERLKVHYFSKTFTQVLDK